MLRTIVAGIFFVFALGLTAASAARVTASVDISSQVMRVYVDGYHEYTWSVSTGRGRYRTPTGSYSVKFLKRMHYSSKYDNSPMPFSVFFHGGYAVHGTNYIRSLGRRASHGCVRLHPKNAARLYSLIRRYGPANARIVIRH